MPAEQEAQASLIELRATERVLAQARAAQERSKLRFMRDARRAAWSWYRIGAALEQTDVAVRRYWERNRQAAGRAGRSGEHDPMDRETAAV